MVLFLGNLRRNSQQHLGFWKMCSFSLSSYSREHHSQTASLHAHKERARKLGRNQEWLGNVCWKQAWITKKTNSRWPHESIKFPHLRSLPAFWACQELISYRRPLHGVLCWEHGACITCSVLWQTCSCACCLTPNSHCQHPWGTSSSLY